MIASVFYAQRLIHIRWRVRETSSKRRPRGCLESLERSGGGRYLPHD